MNQSASDRSIKGRYFKAGSAAASNGELIGDLKAPIVKIIDEGGMIEGLSIASISDRLANVPRKIQFDDGSIFETADNAAIDRQFSRPSGFHSLVLRLELSWKSVAIITVFTMGLVYGLFVYGLPAAANVTARYTPEFVLTAIDKGSMQTVDRVLLSPSQSDQQTMKRVEKIFDDVLAASGPVTPTPMLIFRSSELMGPNAFALPGGTIIITDQIIEMAENDDEIAGVIAHEIGHIAQRHSLRQIYRVLGVGFMVSIIGGDTSQLIEEAASQAALVQELSYSRAFEDESDSYSVQVMTKLGRDPLAFINLLERITKRFEGSTKTSWYSTHPGTDDRRKAVKDKMEQLR